ncbi:DUF2190 family protein [Caldimonas tepidiphila]|uniref:DUF2190 family protein n=1 Tax=Caldimonas tepidiphila TaxID=2315841 RepID=UPI000E5B5D0E|nr:DUF2190 family protein [Caldimonas tepidiphila]
MRNFLQPGETVTLAAPYAVVAGQGLLVGTLFGVAVSDAANGASVEARTVGVCDLTAVSGDTGSVGSKVYWDNTNRRCTTISTGNTLIGCLLAPKANGQTTMRVRLNGVV